MINKFLTSPNTKYWFWLFIVTHLIAWTLAPALVRYNLPMDSMEGATWGHQLEWGYDKNPFLNGWLTALAVYLGHSQAWVIYLFSQISVVLGFWAIWCLGKKLLPPIYALIAVLLLEGIQYYNFHAIDFNDNTLEVGLWPLTIWFFYQALTQKNNLCQWLLTGIFAALGMMAKYYTAFLLLPMLLLMLCFKQLRQQFKHYSIYLGGLVFLMIVLPHVFWLFQHGFVTLDYAVGRVATEETWINHLFYPAQFLWQQFEAIIPALLLLVILCIGKRPIFNSPRIVITSFDKAFLWFVGAGPLILTVIASLILCMKLRAGWGQPLFSLLGIVLLAVVQPHISPAKFYRFFILIFLLMGAAIGCYSYALISAPEPSSANYPGEKIASTLTNEWHAKFKTPVPYVAGTRWLAGNVAYYSKDKPPVYIDWNKEFSPWIDEADLRKKGAIFVWDLTDGKTPQPMVIQARFAQLGKIETQRYAWRRNKDMAPVEILVAYLKPDETVKDSSHYFSCI